MSDPVTKVAPWEDIVLRLIAIYKFIKAALALAVALTLLTWVGRDLSDFLRAYILIPLHFDLTVDPEDETAHTFVQWLLQQASSLTPHAKRWIAYDSFFYAAVFAVEGTGLYLRKHWAEYMVLLVTGSFLPFEAYLLFHHPVWWKFVLILGNLLIMGYLVHRIRLDYVNKGRKTRETGLSAGESALPAPERVVSEVP